MATTNTTVASANFGQSVVALVRAEIIAGLRAGLEHLPMGVVVPSVHVKGHNLIARFTRWSDLGEPDADDALTGPDLYLITEGVTPTAQTVGQTYDEMALRQLGGLVDFTDLVGREHPADVGAALTERIKRQMLGVCDALAKQVWHASAASQAVVSTTTLTGADVRKAVALLAGASVPRVNGRNPNATGEATGQGFYVGIVHPYAAHDLKSETSAGGWLDVARYANPDATLTGEIGAFAGVRFVETAKARIDPAATPDSFKTIIAGRESIAFGDASTMKLAYLPPDAPDHADPLGLIGQASWKALLGGVQIKQGSVTRFATISSTSSLVP